jgi:selenide,water dikinase
MTDVAELGLLGHLFEVCEGAGLSATIDFTAVQGGQRNFASHGNKVSLLSSIQKTILCVPQTSGGLLISVKESMVNNLLAAAKEQGVELLQIGKMYASTARQFLISVF